MPIETKNTLRAITMLNLIALILILNAALLINERYILVTILGLLIGTINLYLRAITLNRIVLNNFSRYSILYSVSYVLRIVFTAGAGVFLFTVDKYYIIAYIIGYLLHFTGIILHGIRLFVMERRL